MPFGNEISDVRNAFNTVNTDGVACRLLHVFGTYLQIVASIDCRSPLEGGERVKERVSLGKG